MLHNNYPSSSSSCGSIAEPEKVETLLSTGQIPIIDLAHSGTDRRPSRAVVNRVAAQLHKALGAKGVVFLVNHGICEDLMQTAWSFLDQFCDLPGDTQEAYIRTDNNNHGYIRPGVERFEGTRPGELELRHAFNICTLSAARLPEEPLPGFRANVAELAEQFKALAALLLQALAIGVSAEPEFFAGHHTQMLSGNADNATTLRLLYYPPVIEADDNKCELVRGQCQYSYQRCTVDRLDLGLPSDDTDDAADGGKGKVAMRCGAHCDYGTFTLLAQDSEGGLEVQLPGSESWRRVGHLPGAILMNAGDILALWTAQHYPALLHRVIVPPQRSIRSRGRHSMAFFCHPDNCTAVEPMAEFVAQANGAGLANGGGNASAVTRKASFKLAKEKVATAYQLIQRKLRKSYSTSGNNGNGANQGDTSS